jgi:transposase-like protein
MVAILAVTLESPRELRGLDILAKGDQIRRLDADHYKVKSQSGNGFYDVTRQGKEWSCKCPDHLHRKTVCKHIWSVYFSLHLRQNVITQVQPEIVSTELEAGVCRLCNSQQIVKIGKIKTKHGLVQRYVCRTCNRKFVVNETGFEYVKATPKAITVALDLYFKGVSQRKIVDHLKQFEGVKVTQPCVVKWIAKYMTLMQAYVDRFTPQLGAVWHSDEMMQNVRRTEPMKIGQRGEERNYSWVWNLMDHETRFLIASQVTKHRDVVAARAILQRAKKEANGQNPSFIVTDKLSAYDEAVRREFWTHAKPRTEHVRLKSIREGTNNNVVERLNGTVRERTKVMRGLNTDGSAERMLQANRLYYNYLRPHQTLNGGTPAERAGINLQLSGNKWQRLISQAAKVQTTKVGEK